MELIVERPHSAELGCRTHSDCCKRTLLLAQALYPGVFLVLWRVLCRAEMQSRVLLDTFLQFNIFGFVCDEKKTAHKPFVTHRAGFGLDWKTSGPYGTRLPMKLQARWAPNALVDPKPSYGSLTL